MNRANPPARFGSGQNGQFDSDTVHVVAFKCSGAVRGGCRPRHLAFLRHREVGNRALGRPGKSNVLRQMFAGILVSRLLRAALQNHGVGCE